MAHKLLENKVRVFLNKVIGANFLTTSQADAITISFVIDPQNSVRNFKFEFDYKHNYNALREVFIDSGYMLDIITFNDNSTITLSFHYNQARADNGDSNDDTTTSKTLKSCWIESSSRNEQLDHKIRDFLNLDPEHYITIRYENNIFIKLFNGQDFQNLDQEKTTKAIIFFKLMSDPKFHVNFGKFLYEHFNLELLRIRKSQHSGVVEFNFRKAKEIADEVFHKLPEVIVHDTVRDENIASFVDNIINQQVQRAPAKEYYEGNEGLYIKRDKKEKLIQSSNICHYLKWNITDSLSLRYYFNFEDKPEMIKQFVLKDHNTKSYNLVTDLSIAHELRKVSSNKCVEILGRKLVNKYHKVQIQFYEDFSKFEIEE